MTGNITIGILKLLGRGLSMKSTGSAFASAGKNMRGRGKGMGGKKGASLTEEALDFLLKDPHEGKRQSSGTPALSLFEKGMTGQNGPQERQDSAAAREEARAALMRHIVSFTDGRVRLRHKAFRDASLHSPLTDALAKSGPWKSIRFNAATGSALLCYDPQMSREAFLDAALPLGAFLTAY
ncbi:hypothetical protein [Mailhella massiliensis]|uniref:Uncharacterized protein n=1 Tax=Mailhella massiliensis TaxID=1903261 RepID=A0A921DSI2_9BACT|nr:hypothetical protein [Mailhella massiliensis]HJD96962.1 hypothetical protein [Mailhella massiliensis]